ncbi:ABC transporter ATP-binding protein [Klugiella xanthotipulae]|uniref:Peptide/nickel transport system ATP-binding protein n=1 Tax=Klugiella xanthotipulae TaxID=244735 RepID=A0A543I404_9MICO|nr:ABC transporter ATP-binding protein [Klugiella xanthotipulae]TQM65319.1 peptide/nickel transport system ATP-binding protein [Klugiella xanthotipulae]
MSTPILDIEALTVTADDGRRLLDRITLAVGPGERVGMIGESGSGKSMTALAVMGLLPPGMTATGSILLGGTQVVAAAERDLVSLRGRVASVVFQEPLTALDPLMRLGHQLAIPLRRHQNLRGSALTEAVLRGLREVQISDPDRIARAYPHEVSGGQRQRVAIAMALACAPELLIADEPTTALDVTVQSEVLALLDTLVSDRGMALLFISHDLAVVSAVTERVLVLRSGVVVEAAPLTDILRTPDDPYTAELVASARALDAVLDSVARPTAPGQPAQTTPEEDSP